MLHRRNWLYGTLSGIAGFFVGGPIVKAGLNKSKETSIAYLLSNKIESMSVEHKTGFDKDFIYTQTTKVTLKVIEEKPTNKYFENLYIDQIKVLLGMQRVFSEIVISTLCGSPSKNYRYITHTVVDKQIIRKNI